MINPKKLEDMSTDEFINFFDISATVDFSKICVKGNLDIASKNSELISRRKNEIIEELKRRKNKQIFPDYIAYYVNDNSSYGINNGFNGNEDAIYYIVSEAISELDGLIKSRVSKEIGRLSRNENIKNGFMKYYEPYPMDDMWTEEYKEKWKRMSACKTWEGKCLIPYKEAKETIKKLALKEAIRIVSEEVKDLDRELLHISKIEVYLTKEEAQKEWERYNNINNEGGFGYVPHMYTTDEVKYIEEKRKKYHDFLDENVNKI